MKRATQLKQRWKLAPVGTPRPRSTTYQHFDRLDGRHPYSTIVSAGCVHYKARVLTKAKVFYFNYDLAREMGLIAENHPNRMNKQLEEKLIETFSLRIINEYDQNRGTGFDDSSIKPHPFMATRYLQLQHKNKRGQTSGDGRSIWNGIFQHRSRTWDVNSRGTGVTCLAPGFVEAGRPLRTGAGEFGYGCGTADLDELVSAALMSEIYHRNGFQTERMLTIIDLGNGIGIGVRAAPNLFRPAHLFALLKQNKRKELTVATDFIINRQIQNGRWKFSKNKSSHYNEMLSRLALDFASFAARLEVDYIFVWLDWDGDNVLIDPGIIDYGSVRQFGLFHESYRYDDVERFSTNILEQMRKAREIVRTFAQLVTFINTGKKLKPAQLKNHWSIRMFEKEFETARLKRFLLTCGFSDKNLELLMTKHQPQVHLLFQLHRYFEGIKTKRKTMKLPDGVMKPAIFNMRALLAQLPLCLIENRLSPISELEFFELMIAESASGRDLVYRSAYTNKILEYQACYIDLVESCSSDHAKTLEEIISNGKSHLRQDRVTGNSIECVTAELIKDYKRGLASTDIQKVMEALIQNQSPKTKGRVSHQLVLLSDQKAKNLLEKALQLLHIYHEDI